jgi:hypothetical protein
LGALQPGTDLAIKVTGVDGRCPSGRIEEDQGVHQQGLFGVGYSGQITHRRRLGVQHSQGGDLPLGCGLGQPVEINVSGSLPRLVPGLSGEMVSYVCLEGGQL